MLNAKATRTSKMKQKKKPKNSLISIKNNFARVAHFFVHFFAVVVA